MDLLLRALLHGPADDVLIEDVARTWTRAEIVDSAEKVLGGLRREGVEPGDRVAVVVQPRGELIATLFGARAAGALVCLVDPRQAALVVPGLRAKRVIVGDSPVGETTVSARQLLGGPGERLDCETGGALAWGLSTSGSTSGHPRTVVLTESVIEHVATVLQEISRYRQQDRVLCAVPLHHIYGFSQLWLVVVSGATLLLPSLPLLPGPFATWADRATVLPAVPAMVRTLIALRRRPPLRMITIAGQNTPPDERRSFSEAFPGVAFLQFYGLTEAPRVLWLPPEEFLSRPESVGRATRGVQVALEGDGELCVDGPNVAWGYLDDPDATAARFPGGQYRTGDLFEVEDGYYRYVGRSDGVFKRLGEKVVPELVEAAVTSHPLVDRCLVLPEAAADGELEPVAWVVCREPSLDLTELLKHVRQRVASASVPARIVVVPSLATTPSGKVIRKRPV